MSKKKNKKKSKPMLGFDFIDYESKGVTPQRFGDTLPQMVNTADARLYKYKWLMNFYKTNALANRIASMTAQEATRNHWRLVMPHNDKKQAVYQKALNDLQDRQNITNELIYRNVTGSAYLNVNVDEKEKTDLSTPLDVHNILRVNSINAFGQTHVRKNEICNDPTKKNFNKEKSIVLDGLQEGVDTDKNGNPTGAIQDPPPIKIDASRYQHISLDKFEDDAVGTSLLERCMDQIKTLDTAEYSTGKMLYEYNLKVINSDSYFQNGDEQQKIDNRQLRQGMTTESVVIIGGEDKLQKISTNAGGIDSLFNFAWQQLSAATGIPKSILTGEQSGTLAGASQDVVNYYNKIKAIQEQVIRPQIEWLVRLLMWSEKVGGGSEDPDSLNWHIEFEPLDSPDDKTKNENFATFANALRQLTDGGIIGVDEAHQMLAGQANNASIPVEIQGDSADDDQEISQDEIDAYKKQKKQIEQKLGEPHGKKT